MPRGGYNVKDLVGKRYGRLTVIGRNGSNKHGKALWECICECGEKCYITTNSLNSGKNKSCGCMREGRLPALSRTHGKTRTPEYNTWCKMHRRCTNPNDIDFKDYGGRGIKVCERWRDFENFLNDMGERPSSKHSVDRRDVNGNYSPDNCRWATNYEQARNKRIKNKFGHHGISFDTKTNVFTAYIGVNWKIIYLGRFKNAEEAILARKEAEQKYWGKPS